MKKFKIIDTWISIILITAGLIYSIAGSGAAFVVAYVAVGGWQLISMLIHTLNKWFLNDPTRRSYQVVVFLIMVLLLMGVVINALLMLVLLILLFTAPFMAIFYTWICYHEVYTKMQRPLSILK